MWLKIVDTPPVTNTSTFCTEKYSIYSSTTFLQDVQDAEVAVVVSRRRYPKGSYLLLPLVGTLALLGGLTLLVSDTDHQGRQLQSSEWYDDNSNALGGVVDISKNLDPEILAAMDYQKRLEDYVSHVEHAHTTEDEELARMEEAMEPTPEEIAAAMEYQQEEGQTPPWNEAFMLRAAEQRELDTENEVRRERQRARREVKRVWSYRLEELTEEQGMDEDEALDQIEKEKGRHRTRVRRVRRRRRKEEAVRGRNDYRDEQEARQDQEQEEEEEGLW